MKVVPKLIFLLSLTACATNLWNKHLDEKNFKNGDITVKWYHISEITSVHDFIDIERWSRKKTIMNANTGSIHDVLIKDDTITIQARKDLHIYDLTAKTLNCYIKVDSTITLCEYMKKHVPENAKYHCDSTSVDITK